MNKIKSRLAGRGQPPVVTPKAKSNRRANVTPRSKTKGASAKPFPTVGAGHADVVASKQELPGKVIAYIGRRPHSNSNAPGVAEGDQTDLEQVRIILRAQTGHDFSHTKRASSTDVSSGGWARSAQAA
jgi:hypothetical protein